MINLTRPTLLLDKKKCLPCRRNTPGAYVKDLSQEHGILHIPRDMLHLVKPGQVICVLPVHSCLTADAMGGYVTLEGESIPMMKNIE